MTKPNNKNKSSPKSNKPIAKMITRDSITVVKKSDPQSDGETKDDGDGADDLANGHDSDNELDYDQGKQIDNTTPLDVEMGRVKIQSCPPLAIFKKLFASDI